MELGVSPETHEVLRAQPETLVPYRAPEKDERLAVQFPTGMRQLVQLGCLANVDSPHLIYERNPF